MLSPCEDAIAVTDSRGTMTWDEVRELVARMAHALLDLQLAPEDRVAVYAQNSAEVPTAHLGALHASASTVPCNFHLTSDELQYLLEDSGAKVLLVDDTTADRGLAAAKRADVPLVVGWRCSARDGLVDWESWLMAADGGPAPLDRIPRPSLLYTSGTTGVPKGVESPPSSFAGGATVAEHIARLGQSRFAAAGGPHLVAGPLYHAGPLIGSRSLAAGIPLIISDRFQAEEVLARIAEHKVASTVMVPTHFIRLLKLDERIRRRYDVSSLRFVMQTGSACPVEAKRAMIDWWGPVFWESYGATEVGTVCLIDSAQWVERPGSVGRPVPPFVTMVLDEKHQQVPAGTEGLLYFRDITGRGIVYHNRPDASAAVHLEPGVFTLGEVGYADEDGYVFITDRASDLVVSGGVNIYPAEAERVLIGHPDVADVACIGLPNAEMGESLGALVVRGDSHSPVSADDLIGYCRERLAHFKCPRTVLFVDTVRRTAAGKVDKRALRRSVLGSLS